jgi:hypothetical protein
MISPPAGIVILGGLVLAPLFCACCAWVAQRRYRRAMSRLWNKPVAAILAPAMDRRIQYMMVLGVVMGSLGMFTSPDHITGSRSRWEPAASWVAVVGIIVAMVSAARLAWVGMPPEPNFSLSGDVGEAFADKLGKGAPEKSGGPDLLDAREL